MKISELYHAATNQLRYIVSFGRFNPASESGRRAILQELKSQGIKATEKIDIPGTSPQNQQNQGHESGYPQSPASGTPQPMPMPAGSAAVGNAYPLNPYLSGQYQYQTNDLYYPEYQCKNNDALACRRPQETLQESPHAKFCLGCGFPVPLLENREIRGRRGTYQIGKLIGKRGLGRLYTGLQKNDLQPIIIKEFLLPSRCFKDSEDWQERQSTFIRVGNLTSVDGLERDFRLVMPWEAIADEQDRRCYLITKGSTDALLTLKDYRTQNGPMKEESIKILLDQILQSLEFLHGQRFQFSSGQIQSGLVHGNLSLDSLLIYVANYQDFFIYLTDLLLWEYLFQRPDRQIEPKTIADDLKAVGEIGCQMLVGNTVQFDPRNDQQWPKIQPELKQFILQLLGLLGSFSSATQAREALFKLPQPLAEQSRPLTPDEDLDKSSKNRWLPWVLVPSVILLSLGIGGIIWNSLKGKETTVQTTVLIPYIRDIKNVPSGEFTYTTETQGTGEYVLLTPTLLSTGNSLIEEVETQQPGLKLQETLADDQQQARQKIEDEMANFGVISQIQPLNSDTLISEKIAYDGVLIIVPFSFAKREKGLPKALGGKISFEQLRQLYTGKVQNWRDIGGPDLPVKLYIPTESAAIELFEEKVLQDKTSIALFRDLIQRGEIEQRETVQTLQKLQAEFEQEQIGGISFGVGSQIFSYCGGYPLAIDNSQDTGLIATLKGLFGIDDTLQPWIQPNNRPINPKINLCKKGSYHLDQELFQTQEYPLSFSLNVLYPRDNRQDFPEYQIGKKFAEMMKTEEGQRLLEETHLIPLQPLK